MPSVKIQGHRDMQHKRLMMVLITGLMMSLGFDTKCSAADLFDSITGQSTPYDMNLLGISFNNSGDFMAQQFSTTGANTVIDRVSLVLGIAPAATGNINMSIYSTNPSNSEPLAQIVGSSRTVNVATFPTVTLNGSTFQSSSPPIDFSGLNINLATAGNYYVVLSNYTGSSTVYWGSRTATTSPGAGLETQAIIVGSFTGWTSFGSDDPFLMKVSTAAVPGPSGVPEIDPNSMGSVLALVTGALGLFERRRLKAKTA
jgi:hypothetical protein